VLKRGGFGQLTAHGVRSTRRHWAAETTGYPNPGVEQAPRHAIPSAVEAAYRRGDPFEEAQGADGRLGGVSCPTGGGGAAASPRRF